MAIKQSLVITLCLILGFVHSKDLCQGKYSKCICNEQYVACHNEETLSDIRHFIQNIQDNVAFINITGSKNLKELPINTFGSCKQDTSLVLHKLKSVDFSDNAIEIIHGKSFHCVPHLTYLNLAHNQWRVDLYPDHVGYFNSMPNLLHLNLTNTFQDTWNGSYHMTKLATVFTHTDMTKLESLYLGRNEFFTFSVNAANSFCALKSLKLLDLSYNNLDAPSLPTVANCLQDLEVLDLSFNKMQNLPEEFMNKMENLRNLKHVRLHGNPFACDCGLVKTWDWLTSTDAPINREDLVCETGYHSSYIGQSILSLKRSDLKCQPLPHQSNTAVKAVVAIIFIVIGVTFIAFLYVHRDRVKLLCRRVKQRMPRSPFRSHQGYASVQEVATI